MLRRKITGAFDEPAMTLHYRAEGSLALQGRKTFLKYRCLSCHSADEAARGPVLEELYGKTVHLRDGGTAVADEGRVFFLPVGADTDRVELGWCGSGVGWFFPFQQSA